ncbi:pilus assembly FimT family protein [Hydrogenobacter hydrogenophilus]|uniref:Prepilin-type N-terminal cleavage/methylation domain-containing protein n=1 Tax=Hydrogenobacter hydrogenophilus TaxID=35835 RepID=A0A285P882_9AQUI|nr:type II secretion system protein [Hydrogenobacter hydrogenophilus]SNZ16356.1 prepilin-type N-terminal cleavage/methylation domain-containing protein [Hydrogenobacter hydrogenophilus]
MEKRRSTSTLLKDKKGFTLLEVLIVLMLVGILFGVLSYSFYSFLTNSTNLLADSEKLKQEANLLLDIQRKVLSAKTLYMEKDKLFMITSVGDYYEGVVKCAYIYKDKTLYYYEFPYPYGDIRFYEEDKLIKLGRFDTFYVKAYDKGQFIDSFQGIPQVVYVKLNSHELFIKTLSSQRDS